MFEENIFITKDLSLSEKTEFIGYHCHESQVRILRLFAAGKERQNLAEGEVGLVVLDKTPFYPESGGQLCDQGTIVAGKAIFRVERVFKVDEAIVHQGSLTGASLGKGEVKAIIDCNRRKALARAHTATHLLQAALRSVLGEHVAQQGSLVDEDRFRFDFTHFKALSAEEIEKVEELVNDYILNADAVAQQSLSFEAAKQQGALAFFKDKYDNVVRMVSIAGYSRELCAGTHINTTAEIGSLVIESESSIASGIRRIEALVGKKAYEHFRQFRQSQEAVSRELNVKPEDVLAAVENLRLQVRTQGAELKAHNQQSLNAKIPEIAKAGKPVNGCSFVSYHIPGNDYEALLYVSDQLRKGKQSMFVFLTSEVDNHIFVCGVTDDLAQRGLSCKAFINRYKKELDLRGGGKDTSAQGILQARGPDFLEKVGHCFNEFSKP